MLSARDLQEYRLMSHLSLRDVARYCNVSAQMIGSVERGEYGLTETTYREIVNGINTAKQKIADGTFDEEKEAELTAKKETKVETEKPVKTTAKRKTTTKAKTE